MFDFLIIKCYKYYSGKQCLKIVKFKEENDDLHVDIESSIGLWYVSERWFTGWTFESCSRSEL